MPSNHDMPLDDSDKPVPSSAGSGALIERRRAILKGLGKSAALAGAAVPLSSLAGGGQRMRMVNGNTNVLCTISGQMSVLTSGAASMAVCSGKTVSEYRSTCGSNGTLPTVTKNGKTLSIAEPFCNWFGGSDTTTCKTYLLDKNTPDQARWICAALNASSAAYPYSCDEVFTQYSGSKSTAALNFHKRFTL